MRSTQHSTVSTSDPDLSRHEEKEVENFKASESASIDDVHAILSQLGSILFLEFGIVFQVAGEEFKTLYIVLIFHQTFEGLALGTRLAIAPWPRHYSWVPWALGLAFGLTTPIAIAVGLGLRKSYPSPFSPRPSSQEALITDGIFDSIRLGILL